MVKLKQEGVKGRVSKDVDGYEADHIIEEVPSKDFSSMSPVFSMPLCPVVVEAQREGLCLIPLPPATIVYH